MLLTLHTSLLEEGTVGTISQASNPGSGAHILSKVSKLVRGVPWDLSPRVQISYHKPASLAASHWRKLALATPPSLYQITSSPNGFCYEALPVRWQGQNEDPRMGETKLHFSAVWGWWVSVTSRPGFPFPGVRS